MNDAERKADIDAAINAMEGVPMRSAIRERLSKMQLEWLDRAFNHHAPPNDTIVGLHHSVRTYCAEAAAAITCLPNCPEREKALERIQEAMFWGNACIARNHKIILENLDDEG